MTNKLLAKEVTVVFAAVQAAVEKLGAPEKTLVVGNPVRPSLFEQDREAVRAAMGLGDETLIVSFGGSLGARPINEVVAQLAAWEKENPGQDPPHSRHRQGRRGTVCPHDAGAACAAG